MYLLEDATLCGYLLSDVENQAFLLQNPVSLWGEGEAENRRILKQEKNPWPVICTDVTKEIPCLCCFLWEIRE